MPDDTTSFPDEIPGKTMDQIPGLKNLVEEVSSDPRTWTRVFRCRVSGEEWEERFEDKGHGDVPTVRRIRPPAGNDGP
jgi:hypothetical protein